MEIYSVIYSLLKDILTAVGFNMQPEHLMAFVFGLIIHTAKYSIQNKIKPWDLWTHDRKWSLATLAAAGTAILTLDELYVPTDPHSAAPLLLYFTMGTFCNSFFNSSPEKLKEKIAVRAEKKFGIKIPDELTKLED